MILQRKKASLQLQETINVQKKKQYKFHTVVAKVSVTFQHMCIQLCLQRVEFILEYIPLIKNIKRIKIGKFKNKTKNI